MREFGEKHPESLPVSDGADFAGQKASRSLSLGDLSRISLIVVIGSALLCAPAVMLQVGLEPGLLCLVATSALVAATLPIALRRGELFEPIWLVVLIVAFGVTGKAFYVCFGPEDKVAFLLLGKELRDLLPAALMIASSLLSLSTGYLLGYVRWKVPGMSSLAAGSWNPRKYSMVMTTLIAAGVLSFAVFVLQLDVSFQGLSDLSSKRFVRLPDSRFQGIHGYLRWGAMSLEMAFYVGFAKWVQTRRRLWSASGSIVLILALLAITFPIFVSSRQTVMFMFVRIVIIWFCIRGEPRPRYVIALMAVGLVIMGSMLALRRGLSDWDGLRAHIGVGGLIEATIGGRYFLDLTKTAHVLAGVPDKLDYQYGKSLVTWIVAPIPRSQWPEKPAIGVGIEIGHMLFRTPETSGVPPGIVGELYLNFGTIGVFVGMFAIGFILRSVYTTLRPYFPSKNSVLIYAVVSTQLALGLSNSVSGTAAKTLQELIPLVLALHLLKGTGEELAAGSPQFDEAEVDIPA